MPEKLIVVVTYSPSGEFAPLVELPPELVGKVAIKYINADVSPNDSLVISRNDISLYLAVEDPVAGDKFSDHLVALRPGVDAQSDECFDIRNVVGNRDDFDHAKERYRAALLREGGGHIWNHGRVNTEDLVRLAHAIDHYEIDANGHHPPPMKGKRAE